MSTRDLKFGVLLGSLRRQSFSRAIANTLDELAPDDVCVSLLDPVSDIPPYNEDVQNIGIPPEVFLLARGISESDAVVIVTPEYNHSIPGALKNALDWLSRLPQQPFAGKPVAVQTASPGLFGGVRARPHLIQVMLSLDALLLNRPEITVTGVKDKVDPKTALLRDEKTRELIARQLASLRDLAKSRLQKAPEETRDGVSPQPIQDTGQISR